MIEQEKTFITLIREYLGEIISCIPLPGLQFFEEEASEPPELSQESLFIEAMKLGIDPATLSPDELKRVVTGEMAETDKEQVPSDAVT